PLVLMVRDKPVSRLVIVMFAFATAAPEGSVTVPTMVASDCATACAAKSRTSAAKRTVRRRSQRRRNLPILPACVGEREFMCQPPSLYGSGQLAGTQTPRYSENVYGVTSDRRPLSSTKSILLLFIL